MFLKLLFLLKLVIRLFLWVFRCSLMKVLSSISLLMMDIFAICTSSFLMIWNIMSTWLSGRVMIIYLILVRK